MRKGDSKIADTTAMADQTAPSGMAHEAEIVVPGTFVVLQGIPGDGLSNTIDTAPFLMEDYDHLMHTDEEESASSDFHHVASAATVDVISYQEDSSEEDEEKKQPMTTANLGTAPRSPMMMGGYNSLLSNNPTATTKNTITPLVLNPATASSSTARAVTLTPRPPHDKATTTVDSSFIVVTEEEEESSNGSGDPRGRRQQIMSKAQLEAIQHWEIECRNAEVRERKEWRSHVEESAEEEQMWWQSRGRLAILSDLPTKSGRVVQCTASGSLAPGCTVVGSQLVTLDSNTLQQKEENKKPDGVQLRGHEGVVQMLKIESPLVGYCVLSLDGYAFLGPGLPSTYADPQVWMWRVTCPDGAYVREGLELNSTHVQTLPYGSFLRVSRKTVNTQGLSRLRIHALLQDDSNDKQLQVEGWVSEALNPLSGQRGPIVQPVSFPVPALYRVTLPAGAVIRSDVELSTSQIGHAPMGSILTVVGRAFSEHPMDHCIERFQLAGCGGWVSIRLNRPPPKDELVMEMVGIDGKFDPEMPGLFHLQAHERVQAEHQQVVDLVGDNDSDQHREMYRRMSSNISRGDLSSINEDDEEGGRGGASYDELGSSSSSSSRPETTATNGSAVPTLFRSGFAGGGATPRSGASSNMSRGHNLSEERCLICLTAERNATIVHGETGHIACCLVCARILKARGDRCPVCRLPIDSVIQQFWA